MNRLPHQYACPICGGGHVAASSCGNRHCPTCQNRRAAEWVHNQQERLLPCEYFLLTFTLPEELRGAARGHPREIYDALMDCAAEALRLLEADGRFVGCHTPGYLGFLHTWGRQMQFHPHAHFIVPGGGLSKDALLWMPCRGHFLVHVKPLSVMEFIRRYLLHVLPKGFVKVWHYGFLHPNFRLGIQELTDLVRMVLAPVPAYRPRAHRNNRAPRQAAYLFCRTNPCFVGLFLLSEST